MDNKIIYISYYTENTPYEQEINKYLLPSLKKFNLSYDIEAVKDLGSWQKNTGYKSTFILKMLKKHKCPVVFLDADAEILKQPTLFNNISEEYDIGVHYLHWGWIWHQNKEHSRRDLLSGTMYISYSPKTLHLVKLFIDTVKKNPNIWEQKAMQQVVENKKDIKIFKLPYSYITFPMADNTLPLHAVKKEDIVILHHQASRRLKNRLNWK